jgi:hypothetical protein
MGRPDEAIKQYFENNGLSLAAFSLFVIFAALQIFTGHHAFNADEMEHGRNGVSLVRYLNTPHFWEALFENWESEFLQMGVLIVLSEKLRQKGSAQSRKLKKDEAEEKLREKKIEDQARTAGKTPWMAQAGGWKRTIYANSLLLAFAGLFIASLLGHIIASYLRFKNETFEHGLDPGTIWSYLGSSKLWFESMQNWQSEFLAVFSIVFLSIWLRAKNSTESKPVGAAHDFTGH